MIVYFCYPPAFVGYTLPRHTHAVSLMAFHNTEAVEDIIIIIKYLSFVFSEGVIHLPSIFGKDLTIFKGKDLLWRMREKTICWCSVQSYSNSMAQTTDSLTSPLETGKANFIRTSKMDFLSVSSICLCANRRLRISWKQAEQQIMVSLRDQELYVNMQKSAKGLAASTPFVVKL